MLGLLKLSGLMAIAPLPALPFRKQGNAAPLPSPKTVSPRQRKAWVPDRVHTYSETVISLPQPVPRAIKLLGFSDGLLRIGSDRSRIGPMSPAQAVSQFADLMREAIGHGYLPSEIRFSGLLEYYGVIARDFTWPAISGKRLSMLLVANGCERLTHRACKDGIDKRWKAFRFSGIPEAAAQRDFGAVWKRQGGRFL